MWHRLNRHWIIWLVVLASLGIPDAVWAEGALIPAGLPQYELGMDVRPQDGRVEGSLLATWTHRHPTPTRQLVFNAHSRYVLPAKEQIVVAKTLELLRIQPGEALGFNDPAFQPEGVFLQQGPPQLGTAGQKLNYRFVGDTLTTLVVDLPAPLNQGEVVQIRIDFVLLLPPKQGRWGQWKGVTFLSNWLPVFAVYGPPRARLVEAEEGAEKPDEWEPCWHPVPFVPWHQPFFNEAGHYLVRASVPADHEVACSGTIRESSVSGGRKTLIIRSDCPIRDFAFLASPRYQEHRGEACLGERKVNVRVLALPEHAHYGKIMVRIAAHALEQYSKWIGPYPYDTFTIAESFFGWLGNECSTLVMIDARVFGMPHLAEGYVEYLISHEVCHQWWYNIIGTHGYAETWLDEAMATFYAHRVLDGKFGKNNTLFNFPKGLRWLPNIHREDYRSYGMYGTIGRGDNGPVVRDMANFGHVANLFSMTYDKGSRIVAAIEQRLGDTAFLNFMQRIHRRYQFRILRVADFLRELEEYTGQSWKEFADHWLYGPGLCDWTVDSVEHEGSPCCLDKRKLLLGWKQSSPTKTNPPREGKIRTTILLKQKGTYSEQTTLGVALCGQPGYAIRVPILPQAGNYAFEEVEGNFETLDENTFRVTLYLDEAPEQVMVDPDLVLADQNPANNRWKTTVRFRFTPLYTFLEETDLTAAYDRWNIIAGPWLFGAMYTDPWYTRSTMAGFRVGAVRTSQFYGGAYAAVRQDYRDTVYGVDGLIDHWPYPHFQMGFNVERRLDTWYDGDDHATRAAIFGRHIFHYGSAMYLPPMHYLEAFASYEDNFFPLARQTGDVPKIPGQNPFPGERYNYIGTGGLHYRLNFLTPYWDPEFGFFVDLTYEGGAADLDRLQGFHKVSGMVAAVHALPDFSSSVNEETHLGRGTARVLRWLGQTRLAVRAGGGMAFPSRGQFFSLGGSTMLRGFDLSERQGSSIWIGSVEWRVPLARGLAWDICDHAIGLRNIQLAAFYDVGGAYVENNPIGTVAHSVGGGLRFDVSWFSFVERTTLRLDVAKTVNSETATQFWFGFNQPF